MIGFDEPCWCYFVNDVFFDSMFPKDYDYFEHMNKKMEYTLAPLKSQVFKWFRKVHKIHGSYGTTSDSREEMNGYCISNFIDGNRNYLHINWEVGSYEEAESECIDRLISIIKEKKS